MAPFGRVTFLFQSVVQSTISDPVILAVGFFSFFVKVFLFPAQFNEVLRNPWSDVFSFVPVLGNTFVNRCEIKIFPYFPVSINVLLF